MNRQFKLTTPENVEVVYQTAGFAPRLVAFIFDFLIMIATILTLYGITMLVLMGFHKSMPALGSILSAVGLIAVFIVEFGYFVFFEMIWGGRSPGKRLLKLRVMRTDGVPITFQSSLIRNLLRIVDLGLIPISPVIFLMGTPALVSVLLSPRFQRIGDYAASTVVVLEAEGRELIDNPNLALTDQVRKYVPLMQNIERITPEEYRTIKLFTLRRPEMHTAVQAATAEYMARPLLERLEITDATVYYQLQFADILEAIELKYAERHGL